jgi:hypothetical protein
MAILNDTVVFHRDAPPDVQRAFIGGNARRVELRSGTKLFKCTGGTVMPSQLFGSVSPWWIACDPLDPSDEGLDQMIAAAHGRNQSFEEYARSRFAVMFQWNTMASSGGAFSRIAKITLMKPAVAFYGRCQRMPDDRLPLHQSAAAGATAVLSGGAGQLWLPNLDANHFIRITFHLLPR